MDIKEIRQEKEILELKINNLINEFCETTDVRVKAIRIANRLKHFGIETRIEFYIEVRLDPI